MCHLHSAETEDVFHALWGCEKLQSIWATNFGWVDRSRVQSSSFLEVVNLIHENPQLVPLFAVTAWSIWYHQNKTRLQEHSLPLDRISAFAKEYIRDFKNMGSPLHRSRHVTDKKWRPPITGNIKTNYDGAIFGELDEAGIEVVIQNSDGEVMATLLEKSKKPSFVEALELLAARRAMSFTLELGFSNCTFEGDSKLVVKSLQGKGTENSQEGHIIKDILYYVNSLRSFFFSDVIRQGNAVAHVLTQRARLSFPLLVWMESIPPDILSSFVFDFPNS